MAIASPPETAAGVLARLDVLAVELASVDPASLGDGALADDLVALRRAMDQLEGVFARWAHAGHRRAVGSVDGVASTAAWLRHRARMREGDARAAIECGEVCDLLPATGHAWRAGEISTGEARTIIGARVRGHDDVLAACEPELLTIAREHRTRDLRNACAHFRNLARADGTKPGERDGLYLSPTFDGRTVVSGELTDLAAETVATTIHAYSDPPDADDFRTVAQRNAAALVRACEVALGHLDDPKLRRVQKHVTVVVDWTTLTESALGRCDGEFTGPIHPAAVAQLLCDSKISRVVTGPGSVPIDLGRTRRVIGPSLRRALVVRDQGCRWPGCNRPAAWCDGHHVREWQDGGATDFSNCVLLCDRHHANSHLPGWSVELDGRTFRVFRPDGSELTDGPARTRPPP